MILMKHTLTYTPTHTHTHTLSVWSWESWLFPMSYVHNAPKYTGSLMKAARCGLARSTLLYDQRGRKRRMNIRRGQEVESFPCNLCDQQGVCGNFGFSSTTNKNPIFFCQIWFLLKAIFISIRSDCGIDAKFKCILLVTFPPVVAKLPPWLAAVHAAVKAQEKGKCRGKEGEEAPRPLGSAFKTDQTRLKGTQPRHRSKQPGNEKWWWEDRRDQGRGSQRYRHAPLTLFDRLKALEKQT